MADRAAKTALFDQFARIGKALGSAVRLELLDLLAQGERTVEDLAGAASLPLSTASAHLQTLKRARLVSTRRSGTRIYYSLAGDDVARLYVRLRAVAQSHLPDIEAARRAHLGLTGAEPDAAVEEIGRDELLRRVRDEQVMVLDVRPAPEYAHGHIPAAVSIPMEELSDRLAELPAGRTIVAYCRGRYCVFAYDAVRLLRARGYPAARLADGMLEWRLAGLPVDTSAA
ncbi:ArsR/SmtB family transcription factor [Pseudonocardia asaccharolytica]|uniref:ArsR/SmtB family transcription factor n=1 Tax=Pseudonocardia asaccharolytica TaxID=54010 RepID=UPI00048B9395|nr:metalloregulator ArsR/SmtB family transcription factor [Pseudonocardia asaccharolytica]